jgi:hypothetical protein
MLSHTREICHKIGIRWHKRTVHRRMCHMMVDKCTMNVGSGGTSINITITSIVVKNWCTKMY